MKELGNKSVRIGSLYMDGDVKARMKEERVAELAKNIEENGLLHPPTVRRSDRKLVAGRDRVAAFMFLKRKNIQVRHVECTDKECESIELSENVFRRNQTAAERNKMIKQLVDLQIEILAEREWEDKPRGKGSGSGRPKAIQTQAREEVAKALGVKPDSVRRAEDRAAAADAEADGPVEPCIGTFGVEISKEFTDECLGIQAYLEQADKHVRQAQNALTQLANSEYEFQDAELTHYRDSLRDVGAALRAASPVSLCPYCKGTEGYQENCSAACRCFGWVGSAVMENCPPELLSQDEPMVRHMDGHYVALAGDMPEAEPPPKKKPGARRAKPTNDDDFFGVPE